MVHIKWAFALLVAVALSIIGTQYATEKYVNERIMGQIAEMSIMRNAGYTGLVKQIDQGKYEEARTKLLKMFDMEVKDISRARQVMTDSCFASANSEYIGLIDRYLAPPSVSGGVKK